MACLQNYSGTTNIHNIVLPIKILSQPKIFPKKSGKIINNVVINNSLQKNSTNNFIYKLEIISDREPPQSFVGSPLNSFLEHLDKRIDLY